MADLNKVDEKLDALAAKVERHKLTKWILVALALALLVALGLWATKARATGGHHVVPIIVKPVVPPVPPVVTPPPASVPVSPPSSGAAPSQPSGGGGGTLGWYVMGAVAIYFGAVIRSHWIWCAEDDRKPAKERKCYRPLRDGFPK